MEKLRTATNAGINWVRDSIPVITKNLIGLEAEDYYKKHHESLDGWNGRSNEGRIAEKMNHLVGGAKEYFSEHSLHGGSQFHKGPIFGQILGSRGRHTLQKMELRRFRDNSWWKPIIDLTETHFKTNTPIESYHRYATHEQMILLQTFNTAGVYLNQSPEIPEWFYLGTAKDVPNRNKGHRNSDLYLVRAYPTVTQKTAKELETTLHERVVRTGLIKAVRIPEAPIGSQGAYRLANGCDPVELIDSIVNLDYREFCRGTVGIDSSLQLLKTTHEDRQLEDNL